MNKISKYFYSIFLVDSGSSPCEIFKGHFLEVNLICFLWLSVYVNKSCFYFMYKYIKFLLQFAKLIPRTACKNVLRVVYIRLLVQREEKHSSTWRNILILLWFHTLLVIYCMQILIYRLPNWFFSNKFRSKWLDQTLMMMVSLSRKCST